MKRIDDRTVELTLDEQTLSDAFDSLLDVGYGINDAIDQLRTDHPDQDPEFWSWLG